MRVECSIEPCLSAQLDGDRPVLRVELDRAGTAAERNRAVDRIRVDRAGDILQLNRAVMCLRVQRAIEVVHPDGTFFRLQFERRIARRANDEEDDGVDVVGNVRRQLIAANARRDALHVAMPRHLARFCRVRVVISTNDVDAAFIGRPNGERTKSAYLVHVFFNDRQTVTAQQNRNLTTSRDRLAVFRVDGEIASGVAKTRQKGQSDKHKHDGDHAFHAALDAARQTKLVPSTAPGRNEVREVLRRWQNHDRELATGRAEKLDVELVHSRDRTDGNTDHAHVLIECIGPDDEGAVPTNFRAAHKMLLR